MSYYGRPMGDYKTYGYAGDPGFLSSLWRGVRKIAGPIIGGIVGGPVGAVIGGLTSGGRVGTPPIMAQQGGGLPVSVGVSMPGGAQFGVQTTVPLRGKYGFPRPPTAIARDRAAMVGPGGACPSGYHFAKDGSGRMVRNRRMNVANPRALRRSMRRVQGFEKLARRTITFTIRVRMKKRKTT